MAEEALEKYKWKTMEMKNNTNKWIPAEDCEILSDNMADNNDGTTHLLQVAIGNYWLVTNSMSSTWRMHWRREHETGCQSLFVIYILYNFVTIRH